MKKIVNRIEYKIPATIDDMSTLDIITNLRNDWLIKFQGFTPE